MNTTTSSSTEITSHYLLINRNFALLWSGQAISTLGDFIFNTTLVVWIAIVLARGYAWTPVAVSGIFLAATLPTILIGPLVGVFVDRWSKRRTMLVVNILQAIFVAFLLLQLCIASSVHLSLAWQLGIIYLVVFLLNACQQFFGPSVLALIQGIVEEKDQPRAIGLGQISASIATLVGPVLAPPLLLAFGVQWALLFNMLSFVVSFSMLLLVHSSEQDKQERSVGPVHFVTEFIEMDALLQQLRPASLTIADLVEAIRTQCEVLGYRTNARVAVEVHNLPTDELLSPGTIDALFRIVQETLANVARHARAHHVAIRMYGQNDTLDIEIHDDGQGFDTSAASTGMGLANIRERTLALSGSIDIQSRPGDTTLSLRIPLLRQPVLSSETSRELDVSTTKVQTSHNVVELAIQASALCILLTVPFIVILLGLCIALNGFRIAYQERVRASRISGEISSRILGLQSKERELLAGILFLTGLCVWYLPVLLPHQPILIAVGLPLGVSLLCGVLALIVYLSYHRITKMYYSHLLPEERVSQVQLRQNTAVTSLGVWLFVIMLVLLIGQFDLALFPHTLAQWSDDAALVLLILWPIMDISDYLWNRRWKPAT